MKLNPSKCSFGVWLGKFLGYIVTQKGIEASLEKIRAVLNLQSPRCPKDVMKLSRRVASLNMLISKSSDKCHLFYDVLRKNTKFERTAKHEQALQDLRAYLTHPPCCQPKTK